ncbi:MAG: nodulation protein NfeD [Thermoplasmata archaeon]|nr:MAG: nodulation protein NfeD [Thermoplasmata archaeon]
MKKIAFLIFLLLIPSISHASEKKIYVAKIEGTIGRGTENQFEKAINIAEENGEALIIKLSTPGGMSNSMEEIVKKIENANVVVIIYVAPSGSYAFSAGTFILMASHIAVMAPSTTIGACQPRILNPMTGLPEKADEKEINAYATMIKSIASFRGRNESVAEAFVKENLALNEEEALKAGIIEFIARDINELIEKINGTVINLLGKNITLNLTDAKIVSIKWGIRDALINYLSDPQISSLLLIIGLFGLIFGFLTPGYHLPEVLGAIFLILSLYGLSYIGINVAGLLLIVLAFLFFIVEALTPTFGFWTTAAIITFIFGIMLLPAEKAMHEMPTEWFTSFRIASIVVAIFFTIFFSYAIAKAIKAKRRRPSIGENELVGKKGVALSNISPKGQVKVMGKIWQAEADENIKEGEEIIVVEQKRLVLKVRKV